MVRRTRRAKTRARVLLLGAPLWGGGSRRVRGLEVFCGGADFVQVRCVEGLRGWREEEEDFGS